ncbi:MAG: DUF3516 domain-containing protein [Deltaproteobacteria bacterium]|nr:DUF3516 domain-containing protein [Deltaproteobacteria bacterium]
MTSENEFQKDSGNSAPGDDDHIDSKNDDTKNNDDAQRVLMDFRPPFAECTPDNILNAFLEWSIEKGLELYSAQEEALLELADGKHVILNTPTGSGKSLVALGLHFKGICEGKRSFYTSPVKALVSEKFFALCQEFGAENVGMMTGDASINRDAPIVCCTAEILSNLALREGGELDKGSVDYVVMDEFHYYSDPDRGVAWQTPLLTLPHTTFLLMSATLGNIAFIQESIETYSGREVAHVASANRPVPLDFTYAMTPIHETIDELISGQKYPVYVVNFTQRACAEQAQNLMSVNFCSKEEKKRIKAEIGDFRFDTSYGKEMSRYIMHGLGLHHAGLLPKYRLLVERLSQKGLLKVICGTDTLGVGVNIPIRTVLFTQLCKFDGFKTGLLKVRDFKQISGRAGRKGFDDQGSVVVQAPDHVIENHRMAMRYVSGESDKKRKRKMVKKKPPERGYVHWDEDTMLRLQGSQSEQLVSRFQVTHSMLLNLIQGWPDEKGGGYGQLVRLVRRCHDDDKKKSKHLKRAAQLFRSLRDAGLCRVEDRRVFVDDDLQFDFSLNHALSLYMVEALEVLDKDGDEYAEDVISIVEAILENPKVILRKQLDVKKTVLINELKSQGVEYDERMEKLDEVDIDKPLAEFLYATFNEFSKKHPWVGSDSVRPKSIVRAMYEGYASFHDYIRDLGLQRSEGLLLRHINQTFRTLMQSVPEVDKTDALYDVIGFLRAMLGRVDTSLLEEWESLREGKEVEEEIDDDEPRPFDPRQDPRGFRARLRAELHALVKSLAEKDFDEASQHLRIPPAEKGDADDSWDAARIEKAMEPFFEEFPKLVFDHHARNPQLSIIEKGEGSNWRVRQTLLDPDGHNEWFLEGEVVVDGSLPPEDALFTLRDIRN